MEDFELTQKTNLLSRTNDLMPQQNSKRGGTEHHRRPKRIRPLSVYRKYRLKVQSRQSAKLVCRRNPSPNHPLVNKFRSTQLLVLSLLFVWPCL
jgi:hypothetical protein